MSVLLLGVEMASMVTENEGISRDELCIAAGIIGTHVFGALAIKVAKIAGEIESPEVT